MLVLRRYVDNLDLLPFYQLPQKVMPHVTVLRIRVGNRVLCDLNGTLFILIHDNAQHPSLWQHETPNLPQKQNLLPHVRHSHILRLSSRESHTLLRLGVPRNRPPCTHHYPPRHAPPVRTARSIVGICEQNQMKPSYWPPLKCNPKTTGPTA